MPVSAAQRKANAKWQKLATSVYSLRLHKVNDADILARLDSVPNKAGYVKSLIRADIAGGGNESR